MLQANKLILLEVIYYLLLQANKLTLATLLEVLDGVMEMDGRMLVITTNYPEKLDKVIYI